MPVDVNIAATSVHVLKKAHGLTNLTVEEDRRVGTVFEPPHAEGKVSEEQA